MLKVPMACLRTQPPHLHVLTSYTTPLTNAGTLVVPFTLVEGYIHRHAMYMSPPHMYSLYQGPIKKKISDTRPFYPVAYLNRKSEIGNDAGRAA